jgi:hypothetical protein
MFYRGSKEQAVAKITKARRSSSWQEQATSTFAGPPTNSTDSSSSTTSMAPAHTIHPHFGAGQLQQLLAASETTPTEHGSSTVATTLTTHYSLPTSNAAMLDTEKLRQFLSPMASESRPSAQKPSKVATI